ncbi:hypothetical protein Ancab_031909 [Ancistrocladus abbreviatus]
MVVCNVDSNGKASESSELGTRRNIAGNNDPDLVSAEAEDVISEFQSSINDVLRQLEEEDNGEARILKATYREVGQLRTVSAKYADGDKERAMGSYPINDNINLFPEEVGIRLGLSEDIGPAGVMSLGSPMQQVEELGCHLVEALDYVSRHRGLHLHNQANTSEAPSGDIADVSIQNQKQNISHSKGYDIHKSGGCQSFSKVFKRWKAIKANGSSSASKQSPADNPSTWPDLEQQSKNEEIMGITTSAVVCCATGCLWR